MSPARKIALSLLLTVLISSCFAILAFTHIFNFLEVRFYDPAVVSRIQQEMKTNAKIIESYFTELQTLFLQTLQKPAVTESFLLDQTKESIYERSRILGSLMSSTNGFQRARFLDPSGMRIHYSTDRADVLRQDSNSIAYINYYEASGYIPLGERITSGNEFSPEIRFEESGGQILFYLPFYDALDVYRGIAVFSISASAIVDYILGYHGAATVKQGDSMSIISSPQGVVIGLPATGAAEIKSQISAVWRGGNLDFNLISSKNEDSFALISEQTASGFYTGRLVDEKIFEFSPPMKLIVVFSAAFTMFIIFFLLFNIKQDPVVLIQTRLKALQVALIEEYYEIKGDKDWLKWQWELEQRREEILRELRRGVRVKKGSETDAYIDSFFDKSWNDLLTAIGRREIPEKDDEKLENILNRILDATGALLPDYLNANQISQNSQTSKSASRKKSRGDEKTEDPEKSFTTEAEKPDGWNALEDSEKQRLSDMAKQQLKQAVISEINIKKTDEKAKAAYTKLPDILAEDPFAENAPKHKHGKPPPPEPPQNSAAVLNYGDLIAEAVDIEDPEPLEKLEDYEKADLDGLSISRLDYGEFNAGPSPSSSGGLTGKPAATGGSVQPPPEDDGLEELEEAPDQPAKPQPPEDLNDDSFDAEDVENFEEVTKDDLKYAANAPIKGPIYTFENPHKGTDINKIAKQIDLSPPKHQSEEEFINFDIDISSPIDDFIPVRRDGSISSAAMEPFREDLVEEETADEIIMEQDGIHYIEKKTLSSLDDAGTNPELKNLISKILNKR
ncbi:MAG: hypothetical protein LBC53_08010 [Spirochaetaceae bacterium]|nr:hypothetical protein [Spirochaetaceae bacterium]